MEREGKGREGKSVSWGLNTDHYKGKVVDFVSVFRGQITGAPEAFTALCYLR